MSAEIKKANVETGSMGKECLRKPKGKKWQCQMHLSKTIVYLGLYLKINYTKEKEES